VQYVALLRGINVGRPTKMEDLREVFESLGYDGVRTVLASGNVIFETRKTAVGTLMRRIEDALEKAFGYRITVVVRPLAELERLRKKNPFGRVAPRAGTRTHVSYPKRRPATTAKPPTGDGFEVLGIVDGAVCSVVEPGAATPDLMRTLDKAYGNEVTTRTWKTIERIVSAAKTS
jgi:uncharacterized protein (DUF1697 family)